MLDPRDPRPAHPREPAVGQSSLRRTLGHRALRVAGRLLGGHPVLLEYPVPHDPPERWGWGRPGNAPLGQVLRTAQASHHATLELIARYGDSLSQIPARCTEAGEPYWEQSWFTGLDAAALYAFVRKRAPARYHEIGSGNSTLFAARAARDGGTRTRIMSVDPQPRVDVDHVCDEVVRSPLEQLDPGRVAALGRGDVLLVDSSHYVRKGSDVVAVFLDVLPALPPGVLVGVHDVFLPDDYPWWLSADYGEQYLLATWLLGAEDRGRIVFGAHYSATDPELRAHAESLWAQAQLPGLAYGSMLWFET